MNVFLSLSEKRVPNALSDAQEKFLLSLIVRIGKSAYRQYKSRMEIDLDTPLPRLTRAEAHKLISTITRDLEARNEY